MIDMSKRIEKTLLDKLKAAARVKVDDHKLPVVWEGCTYIGVTSDSDHHWGYFESLAGMRGAANDAGVEVPSWVWACSPMYLALNARDFIRDELDSGEYPEDAFDQVPNSKIEALQAFFDTWQSDLPSLGWQEDDGVVVVLDEVAFDTLLKQRPTDNIDGLLNRDGEVADQ